MNAPAHFDAPAAERPGFREFVALIASVMAMVALAIDAMLPALPAIGEAFAIVEDNHRQYVISAFMIGFGLAQFFIGTLSDRFGRRGILLIALSGYATFGVLCAFATTFEWLLAARFAQGCCAAGGRVLVVTIVRDRYAGRQMARVMSLAFIVFMAVPILAPAIGQIILMFAPWRWIFLLLGVAGLAVAIWVALRLPETLAREDRLPMTPRRIAASFATVLRDRQSTGYTVAAALLTGSLFGFINSVQQVFADVFRAPELLAPVFAAVAGTMAIGSLINSRIVVRLGMRRIGHSAIIGFTLFAMLHLGFALAGSESLLVFALIQAGMMGSFGLASANFSALAMENLGAVAGTASSLQGSFSTITGALIGVFIGQSFDGTTIPLDTGFVLCGLGAIVAVLVTERGRLFGGAAKQ